MTIQIALPLFEGPLDLLLHLIKQNKIDIYDIPVALITKQYLDYLELMKELDLEIASEFLIMAATLVYIKSRMLLPRSESEQQEDDPRKELVEQLIEYEALKEVSSSLRERYDYWSKSYLRDFSNEIDAPVYEIYEISVYDLFVAFRKLIEKPEPPIIIVQELIKVEDKIEHIQKVLREKKSVKFYELFDNYSKNGDKASKLEIIVTFLALLELLKLGVIKAYQEKNFDIIYIKLEEEHANSSYL